MAISKIILNGITQMDLTQDTTDASKTLASYTGHSADGEAFTGSYVPSSATLQSKTKSYTPSETAQSETVTADSGYDGLSSVSLSVGAVSSTYVGSEIARKSSSDLTASGATVTAPAGYYASSASKSVASGSATPASTISATGATVTTGTNTLTLSKSVSNTPQVSAGYVASGTAGNSSVSLTASVTTKGAQTYTPTTSTQTISANQYLTGAQTIGAIPSQYIVPSGNKEITANGTGIDVAQYSTVSVNVSGSTGKNTQVAHGTKRIAATAYTDVGYEITVAKTGTYNAYWAGWRSSTSGTNGAQLYVNGTASGNAVTTFDATWTNVQNGSRTSVSLTQGDKVTLRARSRGTSYYMYIFFLSIEEV